MQYIVKANFFWFRPSSRLVVVVQSTSEVEILWIVGYSWSKFSVPHVASGTNPTWLSTQPTPNAAQNTPIDPKHPTMVHDDCPDCPLLAHRHATDSVEVLEPYNHTHGQLAIYTLWRVWMVCREEFCVGFVPEATWGMLNLLQLYNRMKSI